MIHKAQSALVSTFDRDLPRIPLQHFLKNATDSANIAWEANDCGEQSGNPTVDRGRDFPLCAQATVDLPGRRQVVILVAVGTIKRGVSGSPALFSVLLSDATGTHSVRLRDLSAQVHSIPPTKPLDRPSRIGRRRVERVNVCC